MSDNRSFQPLPAPPAPPAAPDGSSGDLLPQRNMDSVRTEADGSTVYQSRPLADTIFNPALRTSGSPSGSTVIQAGLRPGNYTFTVRTVDQFGGETLHNFNLRVVSGTGDLYQDALGGFTQQRGYIGNYTTNYSGMLDEGISTPNI